ncbi:MAG: hypothetical protein ACLQMO_04280 [Acidobacteriaceae bacterium]
MKRTVIILLGGMSLTFAVQARAVTLPDACGSDQVKLAVKTKKDHAPLADPKPDVAQIVFIEKLDKEGTGLCIGCDVTTRMGVDGQWAGANKGDSYFACSVAPGTHHLCANWQSSLRSLDEKADALAFTAEAGKTYYFETDVVMKNKDAGRGQTYMVDRLHLKPVNADEGQYLAKISALS